MRFAAADLLAQLEHAPDNLGYVVAFGRDAAEVLLHEAEEQLVSAPRKEILEQSLGTTLAFVVDSLEVAAEIVNRIAPEHLSIALDDPSKLAAKVENAGCILLGEWTAESVSDYCLGPSHTLPTAAAARFAGPLNVLDFLKVQSVSSLTKSQAGPLSALAAELAELEGFPAHAAAARLRTSPRGTVQ
jgi:histidinol dehydrogenase